MRLTFIDRDGAELVLDKLTEATKSRLQKIWADGGYRGQLWVPPPGDRFGITCCEGEDVFLNLSFRPAAIFVCRQPPGGRKSPSEGFLKGAGQTGYFAGVMLA